MNKLHKKKVFLLLLFLICFASCQNHKNTSEPTIISMQVVDRNNFSETISSAEKLKKYQQVDFSSPQPYQKVLRVYNKDSQGISPSKITSYHSNGQLWQSLEAKNGRANGLYEEWYPNGKKKMQLNIIEGMADITDLAEKSWVFEGKNTLWDEDGNLLAEILYDKGLLQGLSSYYYPNGHLQKAIPYFRDEIDGEVILYDQTGNILERISYKEGLRHGKTLGFFSDDLSLLYEEQWQKDLLLEGNYYSKEGVISSVVAGNGSQAVFKNCELYSLVEIQKGRPEGLVKIFDSSGNLSSLYHQREGKKSGEEWIYYPVEKKDLDPKAKLLIPWHEDSIQGQVKTWFENGIQESQREMHNNKKHGHFFAWYKNGDLMLLEEYDQDLLIKGTYYKKGDKKPVSKIENGKGIATIFNEFGHFVRKVAYDKGKPECGDLK